MEYADKIAQIREGVRKRNTKYTAKKGGQIHILAFKIIAGLIFLGLMLLVAAVVSLKIAYMFEGLVPESVLFFGILVIAAIIIGIIIGRGLQLKNQKEKLGTYRDYNDEIKEIEYLGVAPQTAYEIPVIDFIAHNLVVFISPTKEESKPALNLSDNELKAGAYILKKTDNNRVLKYEELEESSEYKALTSDEVTNLFNILKDLDYIVLHKTTAGRSIVQIDKPQSEDV